MEWMSGIEPAVFWTAFGGLATLAGAIGALASTAVNAYFAHRNRAEADWTVELFSEVEERTVSSSKPVTARVTGRMANTGDAPAHRVRLSCPLGDVYFMTSPPSPKTGARTTAAYMPLIRPGDTVDFSVSFPYPEDWETVRVDATWITPPTRLKKSAEQSFQVSEYVGRPLRSRWTDAGVIWIDPLTGEECPPPHTS